MLWFKRNLVLVLAIVIGLTLVGFGGYFIWTNQAANAELNDQLGAQKKNLDDLVNYEPSPVPENVKLLQEDLKKAQAYSLACRKTFSPTPYQPLNSQGYKSMLMTNIAELHRFAGVQNVELATNYNFSFDAQTTPMSFEPESLKPLSEQLTEISEISRALFNAKIHRLESIRRVACSQYDQAGSGNAAAQANIMGGINFITNHTTKMLVWPYEFVYECFSAELASSIEQIGLIPRMVLIKNITVEPSPNATALQPGAVKPAAPVPPTPVPGMPPRRNMRGPGGQGQGPTSPVVAAAPAQGLTTILEEKLLRVVVLVHVIKPEK